MSTGSNSRGAGTPATGNQGPAGPPYAMNLPTRHTDASNIQQNTGFADAGMASVVNQFAGLGLNANVPTMPGYHVAQPGALYPSGHMFVPPNGPGSVPGFIVPDANGHFYSYGGVKWPVVDAQGAADFVPELTSFQQQVSQMPGPQREQLVRCYEDMGFRGLRQELPPLENRRSSYSTTESTPATPFYGSTASRDAGARVAVFDRGSSAYTTPSPPQITSAGLMAQAKGFTPLAAPVPGPINRELQQLLARDPAIPQAVPAVFTPRENMKTLEQSLTNTIPGNRNVYIRGLHPTTDDDLLLNYANRFGNVETSKAIIDTATGACKG